MAKGVRRGTPTSHYDPATGYTIVDVQETDEGPAPGTAIKPLMEEYEGRNFPYRGTETHGVDPLYDVQPSPDKWEGGSVIIDMDRLEQEPEKVIPVRIVQESSKEYESWSTGQISVPTNPSQVVGRDNRRTALELKNLDDLKVIYIAPNIAAASVYSAWPLDPGETFSLTGSGEVWAFTTSGTALLAIVAEYIRK